MSKNLAEKGPQQAPLLLYNRTHSRAIEQEAAIRPGRSRATDSIEEIATSSDIMFTCMSGVEAIETMLAELLTYDVHGKIFADASNIPAQAVSRLAEMVEEKGASFVYCPGKFLPPSLR